MFISADSPCSLASVWPTSVFWSFQLYFESFHANLKSIHGLDSSLGTGWIIEADKAKAFALVCGSVNEDLGADDIAKWKEHLHQLCITKLLRKMVNKKIAALWSTD